MSSPRFHYFLYHRNNPISRGSKVWKSPLPLHRNHFHKKTQKNVGSILSYGDYFLTVRSFLENNRYETICQALSQQIQRKIRPTAISEISISLEKHGEFYHPARIEVIGKGFRYMFVINVAISQAGKNCIKREYPLLERLERITPASFLPKVYGQVEIRVHHGQKIYLALGEWFDGYYEFHLSRDPADGKHKIRVWDPEQGNFFLSTEQSLELFRQASKILTCCYNVETFEQIFSWYHAAGDFIVKIDNQNIDVKLITVRRYAPMIKNVHRDIVTMLNALLVFFLALSIRMRLDRLDGVGDIAWFDNTAVKGAVKGFFEGLALKPQVPLLPIPIDSGFKLYLLACSQEELLDISQAIVNAYHPDTPEIQVIKQHLYDHVKDLHQAIND